VLLPVLHLFCSESLHATSSGAVLVNDNLRKLMSGIEQGYQGSGGGHHQQQHLQQHGSQLHFQSSSSSSSLQQQADSLHISSSNPSSSSSSGPFGIGSTISFLAGLLKEQQQRQQQQHGHGHGHGSSAIPKSNLLVPELPSGTLVLGLNLMAYWAISKQARRGFGG
jgi:hypothetical protein